MNRLNEHGYIVPGLVMETVCSVPQQDSVRQSSELLVGFSFERGWIFVSFYKNREKFQSFWSARYNNPVSSRLTKK